MLGVLRNSGAVLAALVAASGWAGSARAADAQLESLEQQAFQQAAALVAPAVVRIETVGGTDRIGNVLTGTGPTTGVIVSSDGYIISSAFNFASRPVSILVQLADGRRYAAQQVATDRLRMLTLLKIGAADLPVARVAPDDSVRVGQWAVVLGRTYDLDLPNVSVGIVSALGRIWNKAIQTDAKVSPANYGGPIADLEGRVVGILVPLSPQGSDDAAGVEWYDSGIGFAIPMGDVLAVVERLKPGKDLHPGLMGLGFGGGDAVDAAPVVERVRTASPADAAGIEVGDRILKINGQPIERQADVKFALGDKYAGETLVVTVARGEQQLERPLTLAAELVPYESAFLGILPARGGADRAEAPGVGVRYVYADSAAAKAGLQIRDRIVKFNGIEVDSAAALVDLVGRLRPKEKASLVYSREGAESSVEVELQSLPETIPTDVAAGVIPPAADKDDGNAAGGVETGRFNHELPAAEQTYWAYVPEDYNPQYAYSLVVWLHPAGDTMEAAILNAWKPICDQSGMILLGLRSSESEGWQPSEAVFIKQAVDDVVARYTVDPARIVLHGFSEGGQFAYHLAFKYRELFRGLAPVAAPLQERPPDNDPDFRLQFYLLCGTLDERYRLVQGTAEGLRSLKYPVVLSPVEGIGAKYPPDDRVRQIGKWIDSLDRI